MQSASVRPTGCRRWRARLVHDAGVCAERRLAAEVGVEHVGVRRNLAAPDQVDQAGHRLPLVDRVGDHPLESSGQAHRVERAFVRDPVCAGVVAIVEHDLVIAKLASEPDQSAVLRAMRATCSWVSAGLAEPSIPITRRSRSWPAKPAIIPACVLPVTAQTITVSKNTPSSCSWSATSKAQFAKPRPPRRWSDAPAGIG